MNTENKIHEASVHVAEALRRLGRGNIAVRWELRCALELLAEVERENAKK